jgi:hypothetical protein
MDDFQLDLRSMNLKTKRNRTLARIEWVPVMTEWVPVTTEWVPVVTEWVPLMTEWVPA